MSILYLVNKWTNFPFSTELINDIYTICKKHEWINANDEVQNPNAIFGFMEMDVQYTERHEPVNRYCSKDEIEILHFVNGKTHHFVVGDGLGNVTYDPWGVSKTVADGRLKNKRIFRRL